MNWQYNDNFLNGAGGMQYGVLIPFVILDLVLRGLSLWKSAKKNQNIWFIALLVVNSMGILPLIYLILNRDKKEVSKKLTKSK